MPLDKTSLQNSIKNDFIQIFSDAVSGQMTSSEVADLMAEKIASAIDTYVKTATVNVSTITVTTTCGAGPGTGTGSGSGTLT